MRFYTQEHRHYCGVDLHARSMYVCILDQRGQVVLHKNMPAGPGPFLKAIAAFREDLVVAVECVFTWYWLADLCAQEKIVFVLGHALYMKAIHGGEGQERPDRLAQDRGALAQRDDSSGLRLSPQDAIDPRSSAPPMLPGTQAGRSAGSHPEHQ